MSRHQKQPVEASRDIRYAQLKVAVPLVNVAIRD